MAPDANPLVGGREDVWTGPGSVWRRGLRSAYDSTVWRLASTHMTGTIGAVDALGRAANRAGIHGPSADEVGALFDWLPPRGRRAVARDITALHLKNRVAAALVSRDATPHLAALVRWADPAARRVLLGNGGRVVLACHVGAFFGIRAALHSLGQPALMLRDLPLDSPAARAGVLKRAVEHLQDDGLVVATIDGPGGTSTRGVECLGRRVVLRRGPFILARITGAPLVPVVCAWTPRGRIEVRMAPVIERPGGRDVPALEFESQMAQGTARWLDGYLRAEPREIWFSTLRHYLAAPLVR